MNLAYLSFYPYTTPPQCLQLPRTTYPPEPVHIPGYPGCYSQTTYGGHPPIYGGHPPIYGPYPIYRTTYPNCAAPGSTFARPNAWNRHQYNYCYGYSRALPFIPPMGISPQIASLFMQGSQIFRSADMDWSGTLNKKEWKRAMMMLGITFSKHEAKHLFYIADTDRSGRISEKEFCEFWVWMNQQRSPHMYPTLW